MAKQRDQKIDTTAPSASLGHNPFGALAGLKAALPEAPTSTTPQPPKAVQPLFGPKVVVRLQRKGHGGKSVTMVSGVLPGQREGVCKTLKTRLGCGARVDGDDVVLQGDLVDRALEAVAALGAKTVVRGTSK